MVWKLSPGPDELYQSAGFFSGSPAPGGGLFATYIFVS